MTLKWFALPRPSWQSIAAGMRLWGAVEDRWQYVISYDPQYQVWAASVKLHNVGEPKDFTDLGTTYDTRDQAVAACERHQRESD